MDAVSLQEDLSHGLHSILIAKLVKYMLEKSTTRWVENTSGLQGSKGCNQ